MGIEVKGLEAAKRAVRDRVYKSQEEVKREIEELAKLIADGMREMYAATAAQSLGNERPDVEVYWGDDDVLYIKASGRDLYFVEFGTGAEFQGNEATELGSQYGMTPRSWSIKHAGDNFYETKFPNGCSMTFETGGWLVSPKLERFGGKWPLPESAGYGRGTWTYGNPPADAVGWAMEQLRDSIARNLNGR